MKKIKAGAYRATLVEVDTSNSHKGSPLVTMNFILESQQTGACCPFKRIFVEDDLILNGGDILYFLKGNNIKFKNYEELVGLVFDTEIKYECMHSVSYPFFVFKTLIVNPCK